MLTPYSTCCEQDWYVKLNDRHGTALTHSLRFKSPTHSVRSFFFSELVQSIGAFTAHYPRLFSQSRICYRTVYYIRRTYDSMGVVCDCSVTHGLYLLQSDRNTVLLSYTGPCARLLSLLLEIAIRHLTPCGTAGFADSDLESQYLMKIWRRTTSIFHSSAANRCLPFLFLLL